MLHRKGIILNGKVKLEVFYHHHQWSSKVRSFLKAALIWESGDVGYRYKYCWKKWKWRSLSSVRLFMTLWTIVHWALLLMEFSRQEYWSGLPFLLQGIFLTQESNPCLLHSLSSEPPGWQVNVTSLLQTCFLLCGVRWLEWTKDKALSWGADGQMSFPPMWLPLGWSSKPLPPPQLCRKLWRMGQAYIPLFQVLCVEWGCLLWWTGLFLWAVFLSALYFSVLSFIF